MWMGLGVMVGYLIECLGKHTSFGERDAQSRELTPRRMSIHVSFRST